MEILFRKKVPGLKDDFVRRVQNTFADEGPESRLRHILIRNVSLLAITEAWLDFWSYPIVVFGSIFILFAALLCGILIIISSFSLPAARLWISQQLNKRKRTIGGGRGDFKFHHQNG